MNITKVFVFLIVVICCLALYLLYIQPILLWKDSEEKYLKTMTNLHHKNVPKSLGLYMDANIVNSILKDIPATPLFYYETCPDDFYKCGYMFPNLDITNFDDELPHTLLCKTKQTYNILKEKFPDKVVIYTGFTSNDKYDPKINKDYNKFIHIAGKSPYKGTIGLLQTWCKNPQLPNLTIIARQKIGNDCKQLIADLKPSNITLVNDIVSDV